jgi:hypothetical protein
VSRQELGARAIEDGDFHNRVVEVTRHGVRLVEMEPEEALALAAELCESAREAIFGRDELPVGPAETALLMLAEGGRGAGG